MNPASPLEHIRSWSAAQRWRMEQTGRVVFTNGVFDLLHPGHIDVLHGARACGDVLIVGINSDDSVRRLKGPSRPVRSEADRAYVLAALAVVDCVAVFAQDTPLELIELLTPDVIVKGGDYDPSTVVGARETRARGGEVVIIPLTPGHSTTATIAKLRSGTPDV
ncbi:MAG: D-glycero-beta-D-manno-heptose 1-phosphate adenylyltransferase [Gemmatimonadaceae bacterium]|nr:D-glycero-beta-D-manno-heptose 1-phosphate adenylyltransferase [Gemmatimonadaceae bacterium]